MSFDKLDYLKLCKYADIISYKQPIQCEYKNKMFKSCPNDSGIDGKCNGVCYEYKLKVQEI